MSTTARYYQRECIDSVHCSWCEFDRVMVNSPTGSGKNFIAANIIKEVQPARCLMVADQNELVAQSVEAIHSFAGIIAGIEKAKARASLRSKVIVASVQTLSKTKRLEVYPPDFFDYIVLDEIHRNVRQKAKVMDYFSRAKVCGLTATPFRSDLSDLSEWYEEVAFRLPMANLIDEGFAPPWKLLRFPVEIDLSQVTTTKIGNEGSKDYDAESLSTTIAPYYERIIQLLREHASERKILVFLPLIKSSEAFAAMCRAAGFTAMHVDGNSADRDETIERFRRGQFQVLTNSNLVTTGVDIPIVDCFVNLCPMRSPVRYQQAFGRAMRVLPGVIDDLPGKWQAEERKERIANSAKPNVIVIDFLWQHDKLNVYKPENMIAKSAEEAAAIFEIVKTLKSPADLLAIQKLVQEEREAAIVKKLEEVAMKTSTNRVAPSTFGFLIGSKKLMEYEPMGGWEFDIPSAAQLTRLQEWGIDINLVKSKGLACKLMDACMHRARFHLASINQLHALSKAKIKHDPKRITGRQAMQLLTEYRLTMAKAA